MHVDRNPFFNPVQGDIFVDDFGVYFIVTWVCTDGRMVLACHHPAVVPVREIISEDTWDKRNESYTLIFAAPPSPPVDTLPRNPKC